MSAALVFRAPAAVFLAALLGCSPSTSRHEPRAIRLTDAGPTGTPPVDAEEGLAPLDEPSPFVDLAVPGYDDAVLVVPLDATAPRPVVVVGHGNYDRPEWECHTWRYITQGKVFVLCPRGVPQRGVPPADAPRYTYRNDASLIAEANAGLAALRARYPGHVASGPVVYAGFSLGAIFGPRVGLRLESGVSHVALVEGGYDAWTADRVRAFRAQGGARVLFACGQSVNAASARRVATHFAGTGVRAQVIYAPRAGHSYGGGLVPLLRQAFAALVEDDPRFSL